MSSRAELHAVPWRSLLSLEHDPDHAAPHLGPGVSSARSRLVGRPAISAIVVALPSPLEDGGVAQLEERRLCKP